MEKKKEQKVIVYASGLPTCSACVVKGLSREEIEQEINLGSPTGVDSEWAISKDTEFRTGEKIPHQCETDENREHYLFNC